MLDNMHASKYMYYRCMQESLIRLWRATLSGNRSVPFIVTQLAPCGPGPLCGAIRNGLAGKKKQQNRTPGG